MKIIYNNKFTIIEECMGLGYIYTPSKEKVLLNQEDISYIKKSLVQASQVKFLEMRIDVGIFMDNICEGIYKLKKKQEGLVTYAQEFIH